MKKFAVSLIATVVGVFGFGAVAGAQYGASPFTVVASPTTVGPSEVVTVTVQGCEPGENLIATLGEQSDDATCEGASGLGSTTNRQTQVSTGNATMTVTAPPALGTYTGTVTGESNSATFTITVIAQSAAPTGSLPQTGSNGIGTTTTIALGLLAVGVGMLAVTQIRRRRATFG
jgi:LPXTG-motif cell wall-anchored protein